MPTAKAPARASNSGTVSQHDFERELDMGHDLVDYLKEYAREKPEVAALWCFGLGFILGWKLKLW